MRGLKSITAAVLSIAVCITCFAGCRPGIDTRPSQTVNSEAMDAFKPATLIKIGNHTYYPDYVFEQRTIDADPESYIIERLEAADKSLDEDIFIWDISVSEHEGATTAHARALKQGIVLMGKEYSFDYKLTAKWHDYGQEDYTPSTQGLMPVEDILTIAYEDADQHRSQMRGTGISGTYIICADRSGDVYYRFTVNTCSMIKIDGRTGEIMDSHYWDGLIT